MVRNRDFAVLHAGRAAFRQETASMPVRLVGWNGMHGVISGVDHSDGLAEPGR